MAFKIEVVVDRGVNRNEFLERLHTPETPHRRFSSSKGQMTVFCSIVGPPAGASAQSGIQLLQGRWIGSKTVSY